MSRKFKRAERNQYTNKEKLELGELFEKSKEEYMLKLLKGRQITTTNEKTRLPRVMC